MVFGGKTHCIYSAISMFFKAGRGKNGCRRSLSVNFPRMGSTSLAYLAPSQGGEVPVICCQESQLAGEKLNPLKWCYCRSMCLCV